jgi:hypothetical protein
LFLGTSYRLKQTQIFCEYIVNRTEMSVNVKWLFF